MNRLTGGTGFFAVCFLCLGIRSHALDQDVILKAEESRVEVSMGGSEDTVLSMKLSLEVEVTEGDAGVSFEFDPGIESAVKQYRYEKESGILNLYISGNSKQKIFQTEEFCLGKVVLDPGTGGSAAALVRVKEDSLEIVNDAYDRQQGRINASPEQKISVGKSEDEENPGVENPDENTPDDDAEAPSVSGSEEAGSGNSGAGGSSGNGRSPAGKDTGPASDPVKGKLPVENIRSSGRDVGIRSGTLQTAGADTDPDTEQEFSEEEPKLEEQQKEVDKPEMKPEPEEIQEPESGPDVALITGTAAGAAAAGLVIFLMALEYRKKGKKRKKKKSGVKKTAGTAKAKRPKNGKKTKQRRGSDHLS